MLRGEPSLTIQHNHTHTHHQALVERFNFAMERLEKRARAAVVEVPVLPAAGQAPSANTRNRNPRKH